MIKEIHEHYILLTLFLVVVLGAPFLYFYYYVDGISVRPILTYTNGVDPLDLELVKTDYRRGEMVQYYVAFCKNRDAIGSTQWTLVNSQLVFFAPTEYREIPKGCHPDAGVAVGDIVRIPDDARLGEHYFVGISTQVLPDGRVRKRELKTQKFNVI